MVVVCANRIGKDQISVARCCADSAVQRPSTLNLFRDIFPAACCVLLVCFLTTTNTPQLAAGIFIKTIFFGPDGKQPFDALNNDMTFRAKTVKVGEGGLALPANTNINIVASDNISFTPGFSIAVGGRLRARVGL